MIYTIIEMIGLDIASIRHYSQKDEAERIFDACCAENSVHLSDDISHEAPGTVLMAGDDAYSIQLFARTIDA